MDQHHGGVGKGGDNCPGNVALNHTYRAPRLARIVHRYVVNYQHRQVAYIVRFLPIAVILLIPAVRAIPIECEQAAKLDGCGLFAMWSRIIWPQCIPTALAAMFIVMVLSIGELPCSLLVTPPGYTTVGARFFSLIHYGLYPDAAMLCLLSIGSVLLPWLGLLLLWGKRLFDL